MQHAQDQERLEGQTGPNGSAKDHPVSSQAHSQAPRQTPQQAPTPVGTWGHNARLSRREAKRAVLEFLQAKAQKEGRQVPEDIIEFMDKADVVFLDEHGREVDFSRAIVAWENH